MFRSVLASSGWRRAGPHRPGEQHCHGAGGITGAIAMMKLCELMAARYRRPRFFAIAIALGAAAAVTASAEAGTGSAAAAGAAITRRQIARPGVSLGGAVTGWTGRQFLAWGGTCCEDTSRDGMAYNPVTSTWRKLPAAPLQPRASASGAWTGKELVVAGGRDF